MLRDRRKKILEEAKEDYDDEDDEDICEEHIHPEHMQEDEFDPENILDVLYEIMAGLSGDYREPEIGDEVEICGLRSAVELNGRRGRIVSFSEDTQRIRVKLNDTSCYKSVKPDNLKAVQCCWVDMAEVTSIAANWNFTGDEVGKVIENWEARGGMCFNQDRTKVRFASPPASVYATVASSC